MYTTWLLNGVDSDYDSFWMMFTNNRKAEKAKSTKTEPEFDSSLKQIFSLETLKKTSESRSIKTTSNESKKSPGTNVIHCFFCRKQNHTEDKC